MEAYSGASDEEAGKGGGRVCREEEGEGRERGGEGKERGGQEITTRERVIMRREEEGGGQR